MNLGFEFKLVLRLCVSLGAALLLVFATARADELRLKDGRVIEADEVWEVGDAIWYRQGKIIASFAKTEVVSITKPKPANPSNPSVPSAPSVPSVPSHKISRIVLKDGTPIEA